jgi:hypothetical protein
MSLLLLVVSLISISLRALLRFNIALRDKSLML